MLKNIKNRKESGFTIIEVLIVLAIAGLILVIVFLAVPALQRSQRNSARKTDATNLLSSLTDFAGNNGGTPVASQTDVTTAVGSIKLGSSIKSTSIFYGGTPTATVSASTTTPAKDVNSTEEINVYVGYTCTTQTGVATAGTSRSIAIQYTLEQAGGNGQLQCLSE